MGLMAPTLSTVFPPSSVNALSLCFSLLIDCLFLGSPFFQSIFCCLGAGCPEKMYINEPASWWPANTHAISTCHSHNPFPGSCSFQCFQTQIFPIILHSSDHNISMIHDPSVQHERCWGCTAMQWRATGCSQAAHSGAHTQHSCQLQRSNSQEWKMIQIKRKKNSVVKCLAFPSCLS